MDLPQADTKVLQLQHLPAFVIPDSEKSRVASVGQFLQKLVLQELGQASFNLELPSISNLSHYFKSSPLEVYDALRDLRQQEYDYQFSKFDHPILIWRKADLNRRRNA